jgi:hypothetical protein
MPTLRLVYLTEQQYADMMDHAHAGAANNTFAEEQLPSIDQERTTRLVPIADATRNPPSNKPPVGKEKKMAEQSDHEDEDNDYHLDTILHEATRIDGVNDRRSFGGHAVRHQQVQQEIMVLSSDEESENDSSSLERVRVVDAVQQFQHEMESSEEESENSYSTPSPAQVDAVQHKSGNKRKRREPIRVPQSFDDRFNDLMSFKAKCGHCHVPFTGENASLGQWCSALRVSYKKIQNNQKPRNKLSDEQIQRLNDAGFKWSRQALDNRFNDLMAFKAKYGHCHVPRTGENASLGQWCSELRSSYKKIQNNQKPRIKLSDEQIQRLNDAGFKWSRQTLVFDKHFNDLMAFKSNYGHCDVPFTGENASLGQWCSALRVSYKKIQNNQKPRNKLSDEQI